MKLVAKIRLNPSAEQSKALLETLEMANECANFISREAWCSGTFSRFSLHAVCYAKCRERFPLSSQIVVRLLSKVSDAYKIDKRVERRFSKHGAIAYDDRVLRFGEHFVSIWTLEGRKSIPYSAGERQRELLHHQKGESDLIYHCGKWYLASTCDITDPEESTVSEFLGVDLGVAQIACDSDGESFSGSQVNNVRYRSRKLRQKLQKANTRSSKRHLKKLSGRERRFASDINHCIAKKIVAKAKCTNRGIAVEDLTGIRARIKARRQQRSVLHSWSFAQLGDFIKYKASMSGVSVIEVDPRNSSRECSKCSHTEKSNRPSQSVFRCKSCGFEDNADHNAARNIASRAYRQHANRDKYPLIA